MYRRCSTCVTPNKEQELFCQNCKAILGSSTLVKEVQPESPGLPPIPPIGDDPAPTPVSTPPDQPEESHNSHSPQQGPKLSPGGTSEPPVLSPPKRKNTLLLIVSSVAVLAIIFPTVAWIVSTRAGNAVQATPTPPSRSKLTPTPPPLPDGRLEVTQLPNGQYVGINDGSFPRFDSKERVSSKYVAQAAQALSQLTPDRQAALLQLKQARVVDTNDAEAAIYLENINAVNFGNYISLVVVTTFDPDYPPLSSQRILHGAYISQKEFNNSAQEVKIRLLIANSYRQPDYNVRIAQQIASIAQKEHVVGVLGWGSSSCLQVMSILTPQHIPLISPTATSDDLTNISPYFFRIVPPNKVPAKMTANFTLAPQPSGLDTRGAVVFFNPQDSHSSSLAQDFESEFTDKGGILLVNQKVTPFDKKSAVGIHFRSDKENKTSFYDLIKKELPEDHNAHILFYFARVSLQDSTEFQNALPPMKEYPNLRVISAEATFDGQINARDRWYFTNFAYHGEWSIITKGQNVPPSSLLGPNGNDGTYQQNFDPRLEHEATPYDYSLPDASTITSYDGLTALTQAIKDVAIQKDPRKITSEDVGKALRHVRFQGVSGYISFEANSSNGDPVNKSMIMLFAASKGIQWQCIGSGTFYPGVDQRIYNCPL